MSWDGVNRRKSTSNGFCNGHIELVENVAVIKTTIENVDKRINGSIDDIHDHIKSGVAWRLSIIGVAGMLILQIIVLSSMWGRLCTIVEINTKRITTLEDMFPRAIQGK